MWRDPVSHSSCCFELMVRFHCGANPIRRWTKHIHSRTPCTPTMRDSSNRIMHSIIRLMLPRTTLKSILETSQKLCGLGLSIPSQDPAPTHIRELCPAIKSLAWLIIFPEIFRPLKESMSRPAATPQQAERHVSLYNVLIIWLPRKSE